MSDYLWVVLLGVPAEHEDNFNRIYDEDHLGHMMKIKGVTSCSRYRLHWSDNTPEDMPKYLAIYEMDRPELPRSPEWKHQATLGAWPGEMRPHTTVRKNGCYHRISQHRQESSLGSSIYFLLQGVPPEIEPRFNELYGSDHIPLMLQAPGVNGATRFKLEYTDSGDMPDYLAIYDIANPETARSPEWKHQTSLGAWPTIRPHFTARRNGAFERISRHGPK